MATIAEQLAAAAVTDALNGTRTEEEWPLLGWADSRGIFGVSGWKPASYLKKEPTGSHSGSRFKTKQTGGNSFVSLAIPTTYSLANTAGEPRTFGVWLYAAEGATANGYQLKLIQASSGTGTPHKYKFALSKYVGGTQTLLEETGEVTIETEGAFALAVMSGKLTMWRRETKESAWVQVGTELSDSTYTEGYSAIDGDGSNPLLNTFKTGTLEAPTVLAETAVREFSRGPSNVICSAGTCDMKTAITMVAIVQIPEATAEGHKIIAGWSEGSEKGYNMLITAGGLIRIEGFSWSAVWEGPKFTFGNNWQLVGFTKDVGKDTSTRVFIYNFTTKEWQTQTGTNESNSSMGSKEREVRLGSKGLLSEGLKGKMAAAAIWNAKKDITFLESLVSAESLSDWIGRSPAAMWWFKQANSSEAVQDLTGNGAEQTSQTGTTSVTGPPPIPYGTGIAGKFVKLLANGVVKEVKRWILVGGQLVSK